MSNKAREFRKLKTNLNLSLLLISIVVLFTFSLIPVDGEGELGMLAFNTRHERVLTKDSPGDWESPTSSGFRLLEGYPSPRVFTPNGDGRNEEVRFKCENLNESSIVCCIYDVKGAVVRQLDIESWRDEFAWDGKDEDQEIAPSGIYIYQIEVEGETINGTLVLAR